MSNEYFNPSRHIAEGNGLGVQKVRATYEYGARNDVSPFQRFVVLETVFDPTIVDAAKIDYFEHVLEVSNVHLASVLPRNTIVGRRVMTSKTLASTPAMFLFPFLPPNVSLPCQPGEHVWVMFEDPQGTKNDLGFWIGRIVEPGFVEDVNHTHAPRALDPGFQPGAKDRFDGNVLPKYELRNGRADERDGERYTIAETATLPGDEAAYERLLADTDGGKLIVRESVPRYRKRPGDVVLEGTNNALVVLGRDRTGAVARYTIDEASRAQVVDPNAIDDVAGPGAGAIDIVVGRGQTEATGGTSVDSVTLQGAPAGTKELGKSATELVPGEGDPDFATDRSRVYVAQRTRVDANLGLSTFNQELGIGTLQGGDPSDAERRAVVDSAEGDSAIVVKTDKLRLIARSDLEIVITGYAERDANGHPIEDPSSDNWAVLAIKANGDIVLRPAAHGYIKLGGDDAARGILTSDAPVQAVNGLVQGPPITTTMGGFIGGSTGDAGALSPGQGRWAAKVLAK